jgi:hypothetical protein
VVVIVRLTKHYTSRFSANLSESFSLKPETNHKGTETQRSYQKSLGLGVSAVKKCQYDI